MCFFVVMITFQNRRNLAKVPMIRMFLKAKILKQLFSLYFCNFIGHAIHIHCSLLLIVNYKYYTINVFGKDKDEDLNHT